MATEDERRRQFMETNGTDELESTLNSMRMELDASPVEATTIRARATLARRISQTESHITYLKRKRKVYEQLEADISQTIRTSQRSSYYVSPRPSKRARRQAIGEITPIDETAEQARDARLLLVDVLGLRSSQDSIVEADDMCDNEGCETLMNRIVSMSLLICPKCSATREYYDASMSGMTMRGKKADTSGRKKCLSNFHTFLRGVQGLTSKRYSREQLHRLARFCYVEGARKPGDIRKKIVNRAQSHYRKSPDYGQTPALINMLRGSPACMPPKLINKMICILNCIRPVFKRHRSLLDTTRNNVINHMFFAYVALRLLGYDVFLDMIETFTMVDNKERHGWFMRFLFRRIGWDWTGCFPMISDKKLDLYEFRQRLLDPEFEATLVKVDADDRRRRRQGLPIIP